MKLQRTVQEELLYIPRGEPRSLQNHLRCVYTSLRQAGARWGGTPKHALVEALCQLRLDNPDYEFRYDENWFDSIG